MVDSIFHILNFLTLCLLIRYIFRTYLYERISQTMIMTQAAYTNAIKRNEQLRKQEQGLIRAYYHQNYRYEELSRKTELWNHKIEQDYQAQIKERDAIAQSLDQRDHIQKKNLQSLQLCQQVTTQVVADAHRDIVARLTPDKEKEYTRQLIQRVTEKDHVQQ